MAITTRSQISSALQRQNGSRYVSGSFKSLSTAGGILKHSLSWFATGFPAAGTLVNYTAGSGYTFDSSSTGAIRIPSATNQLHLAQVELSSTVNAVNFQSVCIGLVDILWAAGGMGPGAATYTVTTPGSLPARAPAGGVGCELIVIGHAGAGAPASSNSFTCNYLDQDGNAGTTDAYDSATNLGQGVFAWLPLASGDTGVTQVTSLTTTVAMSSGTFAVMIVRRLTPLIVLRQSTMPYAIFDWSQVLQRCSADSCLAFWTLGTGGNIGGAHILATLTFADG